MVRQAHHGVKSFRLLGILLLVVSCGGSSGSDDGGDDDQEETEGLRLVTAGDFESSASASINALIKAVTTKQCADVDLEDQFHPDLQDGLDCDGDGGVVAHVTPTQYALALKRATLFSDDEGTQDIDLLADTGTLANSEVVDFTPTDSEAAVITIEPSDLAAGLYDGVEIELYYFQMTFEIGGVTRNVRTYMSDDDFPAEGNLGHHQGDITYIDDNGNELGWIDYTWGDSLASERGEDQNGAGGEDPETGHDRGFFGDDTFWNSELFTQGANEDIYINQLRFDEALEIPDPDTIDTLMTITATFSIADTFFYEDFDPIGTGFVDGEGDGTFTDQGGWAPLEPAADLTVE